MIETILSILAFIGFGVGDGEDPIYGYQNHQPNQEIIRAIDSEALKGFDSLESHKAEEWFV